MIQNKILVGLAALLLVGMMSVFSVSQTEKAIKFRLGEIVKNDYAPGLHFKLPFINNIKKFDISSMSLNQVRMYKLGDKIDVRRFKNFNEAYENYKSVSQSGDENQYNIDMAKDEYIQDGFINNINTLWITFKY